MLKKLGNRELVGLIGPLVVLVMMLAVVLSVRASLAASTDLDRVVRQLRADGVRIGLKHHSDRLNFIGAGKQSPLQVPGLVPGVAVEMNAMVWAGHFGPLFGLVNPEAELAVTRQRRNGAGGGMVHFQQHYRGVPILGGELVVNMDQGGLLLSMNGEIGLVPKHFEVTAKIDPSQAADKAQAAVAKWYRLSPTELVSSQPELTVYDAGLIGPGQSEPVRLVWKIEVTPRQLGPIREMVLVDALSGGIDLHFNQIDTALNRITYTANGSFLLPGAKVCDESDGDACSGGSNAEADEAQLYAGATYRFYQTYHGRDSYDDAGGIMISTVDFYYQDICPNAFWSGTQMVYCQGFPEADDVVAHELTHAVTDRTSRLFYYYQSGAINESLSDIWGEFVDQTDGHGTDTPEVKWLVGEDLYSPGTNPPVVGALRDMRDPTLESDQNNSALSQIVLSQPDRMTSHYYYTDDGDNGGVHANSGINNKAAYLMTDGGSFNGQTVSALGIDKVASIYYETQTNLLTSGSDYQDLANDLIQACTNLFGSGGITQTDCDQVQKVVTAVEMDRPPAANFNPKAEICPTGQAIKDTFSDDFENGLSKWSLTSGTTPSQTWEKYSTATDFHYYGDIYATSGVESLFGPDVDKISDQRASISVAVPPGQPYLHFSHAFDFEYNPESNPPAYYDGGVLEYSTDNGATWHDAMVLYDSGQQYNGTIYSGQFGDNPLKGRSAFVGRSHGYVSTRLNLAPLAGQTARFRWRMGTDTGIGELGWVLDDVRLYTCGNAPPVANGGSPQNVARGAAVVLNGSASHDSDGNIVSYSWLQTGGITVVLNGANTANPSFTAPSALGTLAFRLTVTDNEGGTDTATATVNVINRPPIAVAGPDLTVGPGAAVTLNGSSSSDPDGDVITYSWVKVSGPAVTLTNADTTTPGFSAPSTAAALVFQLTVTDSYHAAATDTVKVTVSGGGSALTESGGGGGGGCSLSRDGDGDPLLILTFLAGLVMLCRRRGRE